MSNFYTDNKDLKFHVFHPLMKRVVKLKENYFADKDKYDYAPFDYEDAVDSYDKILEIIGEISADIIGPNAVDVDREGPRVENNHVIYAKGTEENLKALEKAGVNGFTLPRKYGGLNMPTTIYIMANEIISRADASFSNIYGLQDIAETLHEFATEEIQDKYLPKFPEGETGAMALTEPDAGSDLQRVQLKAHYDEKRKTWLLNGVKRFITNGDAHISLVLARSEEGTTDGRGLSMFLYYKDETRTVRRIEEKMGIHGSPTAELVFKDSPAILIGDRKLGLIKYVMSLMNSARLGIAAQAVGISEAAYRESYKYAVERVQFGRPIIEFPAVYEMLTNMKAKTLASRALLYETSRFVDIYKAYIHIEKERKLTAEERALAKTYQRQADIFTPLAKLVCSEYCNQNAYDALQIHGGAGYMQDFPIERIYRDARITSIYEGTSQLQVIASMRGVETGSYLQVIMDYETIVFPNNLQYLKDILLEMREDYAVARIKLNDNKDNDFSSFHARRLVEMGGNIIMGYLMLIKAKIDKENKDAAEVFIKMAQAENKAKGNYVHNSELKDLGLFKDFTAEEKV